MNHIVKSGMRSASLNGVLASKKAVSLADLPPPDTKRWVTRRKAQVIAAVREGVLSLEAACNRYGLSEEEFLSWQRLVDAHGLRGLRATRLQDYRQEANN